jgi:hypothetical protein
MMFGEDPVLAQVPSSATPARPNEALVGSYANDFFGTMDVMAAGPTGLQLVMGPAKVTYPLTHWDGDTFTYIPSPELPRLRSIVRFTAGPDGKATALDVGAIDGSGLGQLNRVS